MIENNIPVMKPSRDRGERDGRQWWPLFTANKDYSQLKSHTLSE